MTQYTYKNTQLGTLLFTSHKKQLTGLYFLGQKHMPTIQGNTWEEAPNLPLFTTAHQQLTAFFNGERKTFSLPYTLIGTPFQQQVWRGLTTIPYKNTCSYKDLAIAIGKPRSIRAVANAVGRNPLSIIIPCHRVLGTNGTLTGYAGGLPRKRTILAIEKNAQDKPAARASKQQRRTRNVMPSFPSEQMS